MKVGSGLSREYSNTNDITFDVLLGKPLTDIDHEIWCIPLSTGCITTSCLENVWGTNGNYSQTRGGGGHSGTEGGAPSLRISRKKGSFFKISACPRFCKRRVLFCTQVRSMEVKIPLQSTRYTRL